MGEKYTTLKGNAWEEGCSALWKGSFLAFTDPDLSSARNFLAYHRWVSSLQTLAILAYSRSLQGNRWLVSKMGRSDRRSKFLFSEFATILQKKPQTHASKSPETHESPCQF